MDNKGIGDMIRTRRLSRGMSQDELADAIGVTGSAIGLFENGKRRPKDSVAEALADVFNVPKWAIYYSEEEIGIATKNFTPREMMMLEAFRNADETAQVIALETLLNHPAAQKKNRA